MSDNVKIDVLDDGPLLKVNSTRHNQYQEYYDERSKSEVGKFYQRDLDLFGYEF